MDWSNLLQTALVTGALLWFFYPSRDRINHAMTEMGSFLKTFRGKASLTGPGGFQAQMEVSEQQGALTHSPSSDNPAVAPPIAEGLLPPPESEAVAAVEESIRADLATIATDKEATLIRFLASRTVNGAHEYNYNRIFGSQLALVKYANVVGTVEEKYARNYYKKGTSQAPEVFKDWSFEQWVSFLLTQKLLAENVGKYEITVFGKDFLNYIVRNGLSEEKTL